MPVKALVFDIGGVLEIVDDAAWPQSWIRSWQDRVGMAPEVFAERFAAHDPGSAVAIGEVSEAEIRQMYADTLGLDDGGADELMAELWDAYCGELDVALRDFVTDLRPRYTTTILSNSMDGARREEQRRYGFEDLVDEVFYSHELGLAKPDPAVYDLVRDRLAVEPGELILLDDVEVNVATARELGWQAVVHQRTPQSIREITELLAAHRD